MPDLLITIDGPAGAGKTTVSRMLAERLGYQYVDTGALYRGVAFAAKAAGVASDDDAGLERICAGLEPAFVNQDGEVRLLIRGKDVTHQIRIPEISMLASAVSARKVVRKYLLEVQRRLGQAKRCVFEGRDMGTIVFPDADIKFFLDAGPDIRAERRYREIAAKTGQSLVDVQKDMQRRDRDDSTRKLAPLRPALDAIIIDASHITAQDVVDAMLAHIRKHCPSDSFSK